MTDQVTILFHIYQKLKDYDCEYLLEEDCHMDKKIAAVKKYGMFLALIKDKTPEFLF